MDQLKPVLAHKFWILCGVALIAPTTGWWMASGELESQIEGRTGAVERSVNGVAKIAKTDNIPNKAWIDSLQAVNDEKRESLNESAAYLWQTQANLMTWPDAIKALKEPVSIEEIPYRGEIPFYPHRTFFEGSYHLQWDELRKIVDPYNPNDETGKVAIGRNFFDQRVPRGTWATVPPGSEAMWNAQEDVWLVRAILEAIAEVNKNAANLSEATVKQIDRIGLFGGGAGKASAGGGKKKAAPATKIGGLSTGRREREDEDRDRDRGGGSSAAGGGGFVFAPSEEFGSGPGRFVDSTVHFRTRGFVIRLVMDHRELPELVAQLAAMPYPAYVVRIHQKEANNIKLPSGAEPAPTGRVAAAPKVSIFGGGREESSGGGFNFSRGRDEDELEERREAAGPPKTLYDAVMADPYLADVLIAGVMTLYNPPQDKSLAEGKQQTKPGQQQPQPAQRAANGESQQAGGQPVAESPAAQEADGGAQTTEETQTAADTEPAAESTADAESTGENETPAEDAVPADPEPAAEDQPQAEADSATDDANDNPSDASPQERDQ